VGQGVGRSRQLSGLERSESGKARFGVLRAIALYKIGKVLLLVATAYGVLRLREPTVIARLYDWAASIPSGLEHDWVQRGLVFVSGLSPGRINALGFVTLAYAVVFTIEGIGLWLGKRWAEWLTAIVTGSLIPLEIWEMAYRPGLGKAAVIVVNAAIVWYLLYRLRDNPCMNTSSL
jgi:uncharacterized membrane protein (DUF2068 family)